jgi:hypothetical protein
MTVCLPRARLGLRIHRSGVRSAVLLGLGFLWVLLITGTGELPAHSPPADDDPNYVGSETCRACHEKQHGGFRQTRMGKILLEAPRNELEARGCEACHGPGRAHVESGGDKETIIRFGKGSHLSAEAQNDNCLQCHQKMPPERDAVVLAGEPA